MPIDEEQRSAIDRGISAAACALAQAEARFLAEDHLNLDEVVDWMRTAVANACIESGQQLAPFFAHGVFLALTSQALKHLRRQGAPDGTSVH